MGNLKWLTIDSIKQQLRIDTDCEDALLEAYGEAVEEVTLEYLNRTYEELIEVYGKVPAPIVVWSLMIVAGNQNYREAQSGIQLSNVPYGADFLIKPYMRLTSNVTSYRACNNL